ncbi:hypothetical protein J3R82DRAFT_10123 [Butyriboletus roseoflavus]|nr:hypothetical protein J3R82DRAFT_10123 [Butyriboletus roseoflavus]
MHSITEDRMGCPSRQNFHTFCKFCGVTSLRDVLIVTNKSPGEAPNDGEAREHEFANNDEFFRPAIDEGARMLYHDGSQVSAHAILRHLINRQPTTPPVQGDLSGQKTNLTHTIASADAVHELTGQVEHHAKAFEELFQGISVATLAEDKETRETLQEMAKNSLEKIERIRYDLEHMVTSFATENSRLENENRRYKNNYSAQKVEAEFRTRLLSEERKARELAEAERGRAEAQLAEERASSQRQRVERENSRDHVGSKFLVCGALIFALISVSRFVLDGSTSLL